MHQFNDISQLPFSRALKAHKEKSAFAQQVWEAIVPDDLLKLTQALTIRQETLYVTTEHNAVAAKVKLLTPNILTRLSKLNLNVTAIQVKVQVKSEIPTSSPIQRKLSKKAANHLMEAAASLEDGPLAQSLAKIAKHSKNKT